MKLNHKISGSGKPLIIMHGLFGMLDNWRTIAKMLESEFQCILVDLRNHGKSPHTDEMNYDLMANDVVELMGELHIDSAIVLGHSMGGKVAMTLALNHPGKVAKLIVADIAPKKYPPHHDEVIAAIGAIEPGSITDRSEAEQILTQHLGDDQSTIQFLMKNLARKPEGGFEWKANMDALIDHYADLMEEIGHEGSFDGPVLFVLGGKSNSVKEEDHAQIHTLFPNVAIVSIPEAGHWVHADAPEAFVREIRLFMNG